MYPRVDVFSLLLSLVVLHYLLSLLFAASVQRQDGSRVPVADVGHYSAVRHRPPCLARRCLGELTLIHALTC